MLSSRGEAEDRVRGLRQGADDYVVKPFDLDVLVARVERLMARSTPDSSSLKGRLETFSAADLLQNLSRSGKTGLLHITEGTKQTEIYFEDGEILRAHQDRLQDAEALIALLEKDSGAFRFESSSFMDHPRGEPLQLNGILMDAAWLEDEVSRRSEFLPNPEAFLEFAGPLPSLPPELEALDLPYKEVARMLKAPEALRYSELIECQISAPSKVALVIALLVESQVVSSPQLPPVENPPTPIDLPEFSQTAERPESLLGTLDNLRMNQPPAHREERLHLMIFYGPKVWDKLLRLVNTIPQELISADRGRLLDQLKMRHRGTLRLKDTHAETLVHLHPLLTPKKRKDLVFSFVAGVVLWLDHAENIDALRDLTQILATRACPVGIVAHRAEFSKAVKESLKDVARLKLTLGEPQDLADLLKTLPFG
jgi:hypothetical protein